jgi:hypothetical protein
MTNIKPKHIIPSDNQPFIYSFSSNTSASNNTSEDETPLNNILKDTPSVSEIPSCFEGLEEQWAELNKNGRGLFIIIFEYS